MFFQEPSRNPPFPFFNNISQTFLSLSFSRNHLQSLWSLSFFCYHPVPFVFLHLRHELTSPFRFSTTSPRTYISLSFFYSFAMNLPLPFVFLHLRHELTSLFSFSTSSRRTYLSLSFFCNSPLTLLPISFYHNSFQTLLFHFLTCFPNFSSLMYSSGNAIDNCYLPTSPPILRCKGIVLTYGDRYG